MFVFLLNAILHKSTVSYYAVEGLFHIHYRHYSNIVQYTLSSAM